MMSRIVILACSVVTSAFSQTTITWTGAAADQSWFTPANWDLNRIPLAEDDVVIPALPGSDTVAIATGTVTVRSVLCDGSLALLGGWLEITSLATFNGPLAISAGTLAGVGEVRANGDTTWTGGILRGFSADERVIINGTITIAGPAQKLMIARTLQITAGATAIFQDTGELRISSASLVRIDAGALLELRNDAPITHGLGRGIIGAGALRKTAGTGYTVIGCPVDLSGPVEVSVPGAGIGFNGGGNGSATFTAPTGVFGFGGGFALASTASVSAQHLILSAPIGVVNTMNCPCTATDLITVSSGVANFVHPQSMNSPNLEVTGGIANCPIGSRSLDSLFIRGATVNVPSGVCSISSFAFDTGTIGGDADIVINNPITWSGGSISASSNAVRLVFNGAVTFRGGEFIGRRIVIADGQPITFAAGDIRMSGGADLVIPAASTADWVTDGSIRLSPTNSTATMTNYGIFRKSGGTGESRVSVLFHNHGQVQVTSDSSPEARLSFTRGGESDGPFTAIGRAFTFSGGCVFNPGAAISANEVRFESGANVVNSELHAPGITYGGNVTFNIPMLDTPWFYELLSGTSILPQDISEVARVRTDGGTVLLPAGNHSFQEVTIAGGRCDFADGVTDVQSLSISGGTLSGSALVNAIGPAVWNNGTIQGPSAESRIVFRGDLAVSGSNLQLSARTLELADNAVATMTGVGSLLMSNGAVFVNDEGSMVDWRTNSGISVGSGALATFVNAGTFRKSVNAGTMQVGPIFSNLGAISIDAGTMRFFNFSQSRGDLLLHGSSVQLGAGHSVTGGRIAGDGLILDSLTNSGAQLLPGNPIGTLFINTNYQQHSAGSLALEVGGRQAGTQFDQLVVAGNLTVAGTIHVSLTNGFVPASSDIFELIRAGSVSGAFDIIEFDQFPPGLDPALYYYANSVVLYMRTHTCDGDVNGDHAVSLSDLTILLAHFGTSQGASTAQGDLDEDGDVDLSDLTRLLAHFGSQCP